MQSKIIDFSKYSSLKIGPQIEVKVLESGDRLPDGHFLIGGANNLLVSNNPPPLAILGKDFDFMRIEESSVVVGCATKTGRLLSFAKKHNLANFEFVAKLPGTIGGMLAMNAGVKAYEVFNIIDEVKIDGKWVKKENIEHGYRFAKLGGVATEVRFNLEYGYDEKLKEELLALRANQPSEPSAGSFFKNPEGDYAGRLIEAVGLKGKQIGNMAFSQMHANFLVNLGGGTYEEAIELTNLAKKLVFEEFGVLLKEEVKLI